MILTWRDSQAGEVWTAFDADGQERGYVFKVGSRWWGRRWDRTRGIGSHRTRTAAQAALVGALQPER